MDYIESSFPPEVQKGQILTIPELSKLLNIPYPHPFWSRAIMGIKAKIKRDRKRRELPPVTMYQEDDQLIIADDQQAAEYNRKFTRWGLRKVAKATEQNLAVDASRLTIEQREKHEKTLSRQAMYMRAIRSIQRGKMPSLSPPERATPKMLEKPTEGTRPDLTGTEPTGTEPR